MKRKLAASLLAGVLVAGLTVTSASAAGATGTTVTGGGSGQVHSPEDIIDVVVPTDFKIAFNPLKVNIPADSDGFGLTGATQVLSGTYAIQNRSTIPVNVSASFTVTGDAKAMVASADDVAAYDAQTDLTKVTAAEFSLDLITTAKGSAQALAGTVTDKGDSTTKVRQDAAADGVKIAKASTHSIPLTDIAKAANTNKKDINFMLAAGPYTAKYDSTTHKVTYQVDSKASFDAVAFKFTGTTTTNTAKWAAVTTAPKVTATYTLTESNETAYVAQPFDPYSKAVTLKTGDADVTVSTAAGSYVFNTALTLTKNSDGDIDNAKNKVSVLSLTPNAKAVSKSFTDAGVTITHNDDTDTYTASIAKTDDIPAGFYLFTISKEAFTVEVK